MTEKKEFKIQEMLFFQEGPGVRNTQYTTSGIKLLNVANLVEGKVDLSTSDRYISEDEAYEKYNHFLCDEGDFIVASSGIKVDYIDKKMGFITKEMLPLCMNTSTIRFKVLDGSRLNIRYFMYFLKSNAFKRQLAKQITGSAQLNYGPSHLKQMTFPLIDIKNQNNLVKKLDYLVQITDKKNESIRKYDELVKARFVEMFGNYKMEKTIGEVATICRGASPRPISKFITESNGENWIKIGDVKEDDTFITKTKELVTEDGANRSRRIKPGDFILSNSMSFGRPYISKIYGCVHDGWLIISDYEQSFLPLFFYYAIRSELVQAQFRKSVAGAVVKNLNSDLVRSVKIVIPSIESQEKFASFVAQVDKSKFALQNSIKSLMNLWYNIN